MHIITATYANGQIHKYAVEDDNLVDELTALSASQDSPRKITNEHAGEFAFIPNDQGEQFGGAIYFKIEGWKHLMEISIHVDAPYKKGRKIAGYDVNWSAIGSQTRHTALAYARALMEACKVAERLEQTYVGKPLSIP